jgi:nucleoside-diphosphate-sugar epimerase
VRVAVLGGTGRTGVPLVEGALQRGHQLRVLARDRAKAQRLLPVDHERLEVVAGDAVDSVALEGLLAGVEAVVDVTGPVKGGPKDLRGKVVGGLLPAMARHGVERLVLLTGAGVRVPGDQPGVADRAIRGVMRLAQPAILTDGQTAVAAVTATGLDWTVVRVPRLTDGELLSRVRVAAHVGGDTGTTLGRRDLAAFLLEELEQRKWSGKAPVVSS